MKIKQLIIASLLLVSIYSNAQEIKKDVVVTDGIKNNISATNTGMYNGTRSPKAQDYFNQASRFVQSDDYEKAEKLYLKALKEDPDFVEVYDNLGRIYRRTGKLDKAIKYYEKSLKIFPDGTMAHQNLAVVYSIRKQYDKAIEQYDEILRISPNNVEGYFGLANSYMMLANFDKALKNSLKTIEIYKATNSHYLGEGYYLAGLINYYRGEKEEAKKYILLAEKEGFEIDSRLREELFKENKNTVIHLKNKEDYAKYEQKVIEDFNWILKNPIGTDPNKRSNINSFLLQWMTGSPSVSIELTEKMVPFGECGDCLFIFMGGWTKYSLETPDFNKFDANLAGIESVITFYKTNKTIIGKNKEIEKFIKLQDNGKLRDYIKSNI